MNEEQDIKSSIGEILLYTAKDGRTRVTCRFENQALWLSQAMLCELYQVSKPTISEHLKKIFEEKELDKEAVVRKFRTTASDGKIYEVMHYHLDAVLAVGYRVRGDRGTQFRQWATEKLSEYMVKGFVMDDERLKNPPVAGSEVPDYFDELLERIRDIRASERRVYLRVREIFSLAGDYQPSLPETTMFFKTIQNKLHFAITHQTAAELIHSRADAKKQNMGLTSWHGNQVRKSDVTVAKNYLHADEIEALNRIVSMWLDFAEDQAKRRKQIFMSDWQKKLDDFLAFNDRDVLPNAGSVSKKIADEFARHEYEVFASQRRELQEQQGEVYLGELLGEIERNLGKRQ